VPYKVVCKHCGYVFYKDVKPPKLYEIYKSVGGRCPRCGKRISWMPSSITLNT